MASRCKFSADEIKAIEEARKANKDKRAEARLKALELRAKGKSSDDVAKETGFHPAYTYGAVEPITGESCFLVMPSCNTECMNVFLEELSSCYLDDIILLCCDGAAWHKSSMLKLPKNIILFHIPPHTPEINEN